MTQQTIRDREVHFGKRQGVRLTKRFAKGIDRIVIRPFGKGDSFALPVTCIDRMIASLLELKVLMKDGSEYNSGCLRAALIDGSGREVAVEDLTEGGRQDAAYQARLLAEEIEPVESDDEED